MLCQHAGGAAISKLPLAFLPSTQACCDATPTEWPALSAKCATFAVLYGNHQCIKPIRPAPAAPHQKAIRVERG